MKKILPVALSLTAACHMASAEEWKCQLKEPPPSTSSFDYDIVLGDALIARIEQSPTKLGASPRDDAEAGTSQAVVLQNSPDGLVLAAGGVGPSQYGRSAHGALIVLNRQSSTAVQTYALASEKATFANPPRMGKCNPVKQ
ncbi:hypothetical protein [Burkholderia ubonensis]|uniref:hypothetical protein n=1 Tax=Burkholderia ubonensis TaxID=101571 RepID=UPI0012F70A13|nr:hypothetical protein [Burkholderia ubonensis]